MKPPHDPVRLRSLARHGSVLERGLEAAQAATPTDEQLEALERNLLAGLGVAAVVGTTVAAAKPQAVASAAWWLTAGTTKLLVAVATVATVGGGLVLARHLAVERSQRRAEAAKPSKPADLAKPALTTPPEAPTPAPAVAVAPSPLARETIPAPAAGPPVSKRRAMKSGAQAAAPAPAAADDEMLLLRRATQALAATPAQALALTDEHLRRFPDGALDEERELIAIRALAALGRPADARKRAELFARNHAGSVYGKQVEAAIGRP